MYSKNVGKMLQWSFEIGRKFGGTSIKFDPVTEAYYVDQTAKPAVNRAFKLTVTWTILALVLIIQKYDRNYVKNLDDFHLAVAWWFGLALLLVVYSISNIFVHEFCETNNSFTTVFNQLYSKYIPGYKIHNPSSLTVILEIVLGCFYASFFVIAFTASVYVLFDPRGIIFLGGFIPLEYFSAFLGFLIFLLHFFLISAFVSSAASISGPIIIYMFHMNLLTSKEMNLGRKKYRFDITFRKTENIRISYRSLQILHQHALLLCKLGMYIAIVNAISIVTVIYLSFVLIRYWSVLRLLSKVPMLIGNILLLMFWAFILQVGCLLHVGGTKTLSSWKRHNWGFQEQNKLMNKFRLSCKPIVLCYGRQFVIGKLTLLNYCRRVVRGTLRTLLATR